MSASHTPTSSLHVTGEDGIVAFVMEAEEPNDATQESQPATATPPAAPVTVASTSGGEDELSRPSPVLPTGPSRLPLVSPLLSSPYSGSSRHCSFVLLAEFDILKGSQLRYQYPRQTKIKEK